MNIFEKAEEYVKEHFSEPFIVGDFDINSYVKAVAKAAYLNGAAEGVKQAQEIFTK